MSAPRGATSAPPGPSTRDDGAPPIAWRPVLLIAGGVVLVLLVLSTRYGYHRDELYFRVAGRYLAWGYPDQPPLLPVLTRLVTGVFGDVLFVQRLPAAIAAGLGIVVAALTARDMRGGRTAQVRTAAAFAVCPFFLAIGHAFYTATLDVLLCTVIVWLAVRWARTRDAWLLPAIGVVTALALNVKYLAAFVVAALFVAMLAAGPREVLRSPALWAAAAIAVASAVPGLLWQARHDWPQLEMADAIAADGDFGGRPGFIPFQVLLTGIVPAFLWLYGLWRLVRYRDMAPYRFLGFAFLLLVAVFLVTAGKAYYVAGLWGGLWAAGSVAVEKHGAPRWAAWTFSAPALAVSGVISALLVLPVYPVSTLAGTPQPAINADGSETVGWPRFVAEVARVYRTLPPGERSRTILLMSNYGEAGAIDRYGSGHGLPRAYSAHNGYWHFARPPETGGPVIAVGPEEGEGPGRLALYWEQVTVAGRIDNGVDLDNEEQGKPVFVCRGQREPWTSLWPKLKRLS